MSKTKVLVVTGKRGGYGAMKPMLRCMEKSHLIEPAILLCDMHGLEQWGNTQAEIIDDFPDTPVRYTWPGSCAGDTRENRVDYMGKMMRTFAKDLAREDPFLTVLYGDRSEIAAMALACVTMNIRVAHIQGGDVTGNEDDTYRNMISKTANVHFPSTHDAASRLEDMGEREERIFPVGDLHLDPILAGDYAEPEFVKGYLGLDKVDKPIIIVLYHPTGEQGGGTVMGNIMQAIYREDMHYVIVYPCSDPGHQSVIDSINNAWARLSNVSVARNLPQPVFHGLMSGAACLVGNSSAGIIEAPYFNLPAVNIGDRQKGRVVLRSTISTSAHFKEPIKEAFNRALSMKIGTRDETIYGRGKSGKMIVRILEDTFEDGDDWLMDSKFVRG